MGNMTRELLEKLGEALYTHARRYQQAQAAYDAVAYLEKEGALQDLIPTRKAEQA